MEVLMNSCSTSNFPAKAPKSIQKRTSLTKNNTLFPVSSDGLPSFSPQKLPLNAGRGKLVVAEAKRKKGDSHSFVPKADEATGPFPEAVLLKKREVQEDGRALPEFADAEEEELYEILNLQLESDLNVERVRHYEVVYLIHEDCLEQVPNVMAKVQDFVKEKKGKIWRLNNWGLRRLAYKIRKANNANYILMNFEMEAKWINDFKSMLDKDERVIRHLVIKRDEAITEDCPPPPEFHTLRANATDDFDDDDDMEEYDDEEEDGEEWDDENDSTMVTYDENVVYVDEVDIDDGEGTVSRKHTSRTLQAAKSAR